MMPKCTGGLTDCPNTAVFLGPHEDPALCEEHLAELKSRLKNYESNKKIRQIVDRFLAWQLPEDFSPDAGISYQHLPEPHGRPIGTNLLTATQATDMVRHILGESEK